MEAFKVIDDSPVNISSARTCRMDLAFRTTLALTCFLVTLLFANVVVSADVISGSTYGSSLS